MVNKFKMAAAQFAVSSPISLENPGAIVSKKRTRESSYFGGQEDILDSEHRKNVLTTLPSSFDSKACSSSIVPSADDLISFGIEDQVEAITSGVKEWSLCGQLVYFFVRCLFSVEKKISPGGNLHLVALMQSLLERGKCA
jgi:hypothetical protein